MLIQSKSIAQTATTNVLFVLDASGSMRAKWQSEEKMKVASRILSQVIDSIEKDNKNIRFALRVFGHQFPKSANNCTDTKLEIPFAKNNSSKIKELLNTINPQGHTPIAYSLQQSLGDFFNPNAKENNILILLTDGEENCDGDPCSASQFLQKSGVLLKPYVVGMGLDIEFQPTFECIGTYIPAKTPTKLKEAIKTIVTRTSSIVKTQIEDKTTLQVFLLDEANKPTETNVPIEFYDAFDNSIKKEIMHTLNSKGTPDTIKVDGLTPYNIVVHTFPKITKENYVLQPNKHNKLILSCHQGYLKLSGYGNIESGNKVVAFIRDRKENNIINMQNLLTSEKYLEGKYNVELTTLPITYISNVLIEANKTTEIRVENPCTVILQSNTEKAVSIYSLSENEMKIIWEDKTFKTEQRIDIQPGKYKLIYRSNTPKESVLTKEVDLILEANGIKKVDLNK